MWGKLILLAAAIIAVIVFIAVVATSSLQTEDEVLYVAAPDSPVRVRPQNAGGAQFPFTDADVLNQDQVVYERLLPPSEEPLAEALSPTPEPAEKEINEDNEQDNALDNALGNEQEAAQQAAEQSAQKEESLTTLPVPSALSVPEVIKVTEEEIENIKTERVGEDSQKSEEDISLDNAQSIATLIERQTQLSDLSDIPEQPELPEQSELPDSNDEINSDEVWVVQLASLTSLNDAENEQKNLRRQFSLLQNIPLQIETASVNSTLYYRILAGPWNNNLQAQNLCSTLKQKNADCLVRKK